MFFSPAFGRSSVSCRISLESKRGNVPVGRKETQLGKWAKLGYNGADIKPHSNIFPIQHAQIKCICKPLMCVCVCHFDFCLRQHLDKTQKWQCAKVTCITTDRYFGPEKCMYFGRSLPQAQANGTCVGWSPVWRRATSAAAVGLHWAVKMCSLLRCYGRC